MISYPCIQRLGDDERAWKDYRITRREQEKATLSVIG
jgi:hypothetical protein